jgi:hypothetical protein
LTFGAGAAFWTTSGAAAFCCRLLPARSKKKPVAAEAMPPMTAVTTHFVTADELSCSERDPRGRLFMSDSPASGRTSPRQSYQFREGCSTQRLTV